MVRAMARPNPTPPLLGLRDPSSRTKGSKTRSRSASGMPGPSSSMTTQTPLSSRAIRTVARTPWMPAFSRRLRKARRNATGRQSISTRVGVENGEFMAEIGEVDGHAVDQRMEIDRACSLALHVLPDERKGVFRHSLHFVQRADGSSSGSLPCSRSSAWSRRAGDRGPEIVRNGRQHGHAVAHVALEPVAHEVEGAHRAADFDGGRSPAARPSPRHGRAGRRQSARFRIGLAIRRPIRTATTATASADSRNESRNVQPQGGGVGGGPTATLSHCSSGSCADAANPCELP